jgi:hypothetical protein
MSVLSGNHPGTSAQGAAAGAGEGGKGQGQRGAGQRTRVFCDAATGGVESPLWVKISPAGRAAAWPDLLR